MRSFRSRGESSRSQITTTSPPTIRGYGGAYEPMDLVYQPTPLTETGEDAGILTEMGHLRFASSNMDAAGKIFQQALTSFPGYPSAVGNLARVRVVQSDGRESSAAGRCRCVSAQDCLKPGRPFINSDPGYLPMPLCVRAGERAQERPAITSESFQGE
jgi:hypothetical protein